LNRIGWCDETVNFGGGCDFGCSYCYARRQLKRQKHNCQLCYEFKPHLHLERLNQITPDQSPRRIFVNSTWDWNGPTLLFNALDVVVKRLEVCPQHTFQILSKRPSGFERFSFPENVWLGTTITRELEVFRVMRLRDVANGNLCFTSIEPIQERICNWFTKKQTDWLIVGAETGHRPEKVIPQKQWIDDLLYNARKEEIPVFLKNSIVDLFGEDYRIREFPEVA
jgi:protein gp37